uniref:hypothetical protein n=1 Tax=Polynucleobacter sp. TaxID=2029855 RepID=UPI004047AA6C
MDLVTVLDIGVVYTSEAVLRNAYAVVGRPTLKDVVRRQVSDVTCGSVEFNDDVGSD